MLTGPVSKGTQLVAMFTMVMKQIVDHPDAVEVTVSNHSGSIRLYCCLDPRDLRQVEGGPAEDNLNTLLAAAGGKVNKRIFLEFR